MKAALLGLCTGAKRGPTSWSFMVKKQKRQKEMFNVLLCWGGGGLYKNKDYYEHKNFLRG